MTSESPYKLVTYESVTWAMTFVIHAVRRKSHGNVFELNKLVTL